MTTSSNLAEPVYTVLYSAKHDFLYHPDFHSERVEIVAATGWRAIVECNYAGNVRRAEACLALNQASVEATARDSALVACSMAFKA